MEDISDVNADLSDLSEVNLVAQGSIGVLLGTSRSVAQSSIGVHFSISRLQFSCTGLDRGALLHFKIYIWVSIGVHFGTSRAQLGSTGALTSSTRLDRDWIWCNLLPQELIRLDMGQVYHCDAL